MERVRAWRTAHPGYARKRSRGQDALQEHSLAQPVDTNKQSDVFGAPRVTRSLTRSSPCSHGTHRPFDRCGVTRRHRAYLAPASTIGPRPHARRPRWCTSDCCIRSAGPPSSSVGWTTAWCVNGAWSLVRPRPGRCTCSGHRRRRKGAELLLRRLAHARAAAGPSPPRASPRGAHRRRPRRVRAAAVPKSCPWTPAARPRAALDRASSPR